MEWPAVETIAIDWNDWEENPHDELSEVVGYSENLFKDDANTVKDFVCIICYHVARTPMVHLHPGCKAVFCLSCVNKYISHCRNNSPRTLPHCPMRCNGSVIKSSTIAAISGERKEVMDGLVMMCQHPGCGMLVPYSSIERHIETCQFNPAWCFVCQVVKKDRHDCVIYAGALRREVVRLREELEKLHIENRRLRDDQMGSREGSVVWSQGACGLSNPIRSRNEYRDITRLIIKYKDREVMINGLSLDSTGLDLRRRLEQEFGEEIGPILKMEHTPIVDNMRLRQHQIGHKPTRLVVLEKSRELPLGTCLNVSIGPNGPVV